MLSKATELQSKGNQCGDGQNNPTAHSNRDYCRALAWSIRHNYTHGLACFCRHICIVHLQQASVAMFTIMAGNLLNGSMWDSRESLVDLSVCFVSLPRSDINSDAQQLLGENHGSRFRHRIISLSSKEPSSTWTSWIIKLWLIREEAPIADVIKSLSARIQVSVTPHKLLSC